MRSGDYFISSVLEDYRNYGHAFIEVTETRDFYLVERIPPSIVLGGMYYA